jgi:hypothetical protein
VSDAWIDTRDWPIEDWNGGYSGTICEIFDPTSFASTLLQVETEVLGTFSVWWYPWDAKPASNWVVKRQKPAEYDSCRAGMPDYGNRQALVDNIEMNEE